MKRQPWTLFGWTGGGLILLLALYAPLRHAEFVYDDLWTIVRNPAVRSLSGRSFFTDPQTVAMPASGMALDIYRPLATISFALDFHFWGLNPLPYHLENVLCHALNGILFWFLLWLLGGDKLAACFGTWVFLFHPGQVETVAWVTQRSTLLCAMGSLAALICIIAPGRQSPARLAGATAAWIFGLFSKETAVILPFILFLMDFLRLPPGDRNTKTGQRRRLYVGWFALAVVYVLFRRSIVGQWSSVSISHSALWTQWMLGVLAFPIYIGKLLIPVALRVSYDYPLLDWVRVGWSAAFLTAYLVCLGVAIRRRHASALALGWILISLLPVLHLVPIVPFFAERFLYFPVMGLAIGAAWLFKNFRWVRIPLGVWACALAIVTVFEVPNWQNEQLLWANAVRQEPTNAFAHACLAQTMGDTPEAERQYLLALINRPSENIRYAALNNLAALNHHWNRSWKANYWKQKAGGVRPR